jgi:hypothetical protein
MLLSCGGADEAVPIVASPLDGSWLGGIVAAPADFEALMAGGVDPWARLHENSLGAAVDLGGPAGDRAAGELALLHGELGRISALAWLNTVSAWKDRSALPKNSALTWFAGVAALELGDPESATMWLTHASTQGSPEAKAAATALLASPELTTSIEGDVLGKRFELHRSIRAGDEGQVDGAEPVVEEAVEGGFSRVLYDPQVHWTLASTYAGVEAPADGLASMLFSPCLTPADLADDRSSGNPGVRCAVQAATALGVDADPGGEDDADRARGIARGVTDALDTWQNAQLANASDDGQALLRDLQLIDKLRAQILLGLARDALLVGHPHQAVAYVETGLDKSNPRAITPVNSPAMFAVLALARLQTGHTREALDALQVLTRAYPETQGVDEIVSDLAILQGLDRQGDSKEN